MNTGSGMTARAVGWLLLVSGRGKSVFCSPFWLYPIEYLLSQQLSLGNSFFFQKRHRSNDSTASGRDRSHSCDSTESLPCKLKEEPWLQEMCNAFLQQYIQYLQSMGFILVQVRPPSPTTRRSVMFWEPW